MSRCADCCVQKSWFSWCFTITVSFESSLIRIQPMPVDPKFISLSMKAINVAVDSSYADKALDRIFDKPQVEKSRKKKRSSSSRRPSGKRRPSVPRRRSERQARRSAGSNGDRTVMEEEYPQSQKHQQDLDLNGSGNMSEFTFSTCGTTAKTTKYQPVPAPAPQNV